MIKQIPVLIFLILCTCCKTKDYTPEEYTKEILIFGNGGGFSGATVEYTLLSNGQLFMEGSRSGPRVQLGRVKSKRTNQLFKTYHQFRFDTLEVDDPGNMYFYLKMQNNEGDHKILWGGQENVPKALKTYYANLIQIIKSKDY